MRIPKIHIAMHKELTYCIDVCGGVQMPHNQKAWGGKLGTTEARTAFVRAWDGVWNFTILEGIRLIKKVAEVNASPHQERGIWASIKEARTTSNRWRFFLSATPFCWGVEGQVVWWTIPYVAKCCWMSELRYSPPLSLQRAWTYALYWVRIIAWNFWNSKFTYPLDFIRHTQVILLQSSINITNQCALPNVVTWEGPQT